MTTASPVPIETPWIQISGITKPDISGWQLLVVLVVIAYFLVPLYWWKEFRLRTWRWWKSALFILAWACGVVPLVAGGIDALAGDSHADVSADSVALQVLPSEFSSDAGPSTIMVEPSEHADGIRIHVPYQGDQLDYQVELGVTYRGVPVRCLGTISLFRKTVPKGRPAEVSARMTGTCSPTS